MLANKITESLASAVQKAEKVHKPFPILYMKNCFPQDIYEELTHCPPHEKLFRGVKHSNRVGEDRRPARKAFELNSENLCRLTREQAEVWDAVYQATYSEKLKNAFFKKFQRELDSRFSDGFNAEKYPLFPRSVLTRDEPGFLIGPHPDTSAKVISILFSLAEDRSQIHLGTAFYKKSFFFRRFKLAKRFDFSPNTGCAFVVSRNTWHGCEMLKPDSGIRKILALTYFGSLPEAEGLAYADEYLQS